MTPKHSGDLFTELAEMVRDEQEECIHCGKRWYKIQHKDGVCHNCQADGKPGRTQLNRQQLCAKLFAYLISLAVLAMLGRHFYPDGMKWYHELSQNTQEQVFSCVFSGVFFGIIYGVFVDVSRSILTGLLLGSIGAVVAGVVGYSRLGGTPGGLSYGLTFFVCYFIVFFLVYLIKETRESR